MEIVILLIIIGLVYYFRSKKIPKTRIGKLNMISTRNVDSTTEYILLKDYVGATNKDLKKTTAKTIEDAIDEAVKSVKGGEFLKNVSLFEVKRGFWFFKRTYYAIEGDVWGLSRSEV
jgi:hypothetical protein